MTKETVFLRVTDIFRDIFDDDALEIKETTSSIDIEDWDSLNHINLIVAIESDFKIKFSFDEISELKNVGEMVELITLKL